MNIDSPDGNYIYTNLGIHFTATIFANIIVCPKCDPLTAKGMALYLKMPQNVKIYLL
jgi:hypothetical protein